MARQAARLGPEICHSVCKVGVSGGVILAFGSISGKIRLPVEESIRL